MRFYAVLCIGLLSCLPLQAQENFCLISSSPYPVEVTQPDGSLLKVIIRGNPFHGWRETTDGYTVVENEQGFLEYAIKVKGALLPSGIRAVDPEKRVLFQSLPSSIQKHLQPEVSAAARQQMMQQYSATSSPLSMSPASVSSLGPMPSTGELKVLLVLVEYPDLKHTRSLEEINRLFNGRNGANLSFAEYMETSSAGKLKVNVDITGWYQAESSYLYYGYQNGFARADALAREITLKVAKDVNLAPYDNDKDGEVDGIIFLHAGPGAEEEYQNHLIRSHMGKMPAAFEDGKRISPYCMVPPPWCSLQLHHHIKTDMMLISIKYKETKLTDPVASGRIVIFDQNFVYVDAGFQRVSTAANMAHETLIRDITASQDGYIFVYVSNESRWDVNTFFDELTITHQHIDIVQHDDYYPFGLPFLPKNFYSKIHMAASHEKAFPRCIAGNRTFFALLVCHPIFSLLHP